MRVLHPAAWIGFILHCAALYVFFWALGNVDYALLSPEERAVFDILQQSEMLRSTIYVVLALQALGLGMLATRVPYALFVAALGAFPMLPGSLVYLIGCVLTHYQGKYADFTPAPAGYGSARFIFPSSYASPMRLVTGLAVGASLLCLVLGLINLGAIFFGISLAGLYFAVRARTNSALSLHDGFLTLLPTLLARRVLVPYADVQLATLNDDQSIQLQVNTPKGVLPLTWSLKSVAQEYRRQALEELGAALSAQGVPLA